MPRSRVKVDAMIDDLFDFDPDRLGGMAGSVVNGCAKLFIIGIVAYALMSIASVIILVTLLRNLPDGLLSKPPVEPPAAEPTQSASGT